MSCAPFHLLNWPKPVDGYAVRKESPTSMPEFWEDTNGGIVTGPPGPVATGSCWVDADQNGNPVEPQDAAGLPSQFDGDPLNPSNPDASGISAIKIVWIDSMVVLSAQNAVLTGTGNSKHFDLSDAVCRWFSPNQYKLYNEPLPNATPRERPFRYPRGAPAGSPDRSVLADVSRSLPLPSASGEIVLPTVPAPTRLAARQDEIPVIGGLSCYDVGLRGIHSYTYPGGPGGSPCVIPNATAINSSFNANIWMFDTSGGGTWTGPSVGLYIDATELSPLSSLPDAQCVATTFGWSLYPAPESQRGWILDPSASSVQPTVEANGLPGHIFGLDLPENGTAFDLLLLVAAYKWTRVDASFVQFDSNVPTDRGYDIHAKADWYTVSQSSPANWNTWVWGQFRQIVPVAPKQGPSQN